MTEKILERYALKYKPVQWFSSLDPSITLHRPQLGKKRFDLLLEVLFTNNQIIDSVAEKGVSRNTQIVSEPHSMVKLKFKILLDGDYPFQG